MSARAPESAIAKSTLLSEMLRRGDRRIAVRDVTGGIHFNAAFRNAETLRDALEALKSGEYREAVEAEEGRFLELYEQVFDHQSFTGRSGAFYKYEGLGCVYWHMVSKLRLAVLEVLGTAESAGTEAGVMDLFQRSSCPGNRKVPREE